MEWFQTIRWSKRVTTWDEFVRILRTRFVVPAEEEESLGNVKDEEEQPRDKISEIPEAKTDPDEEEKNDDEAKQPIVPEPDPTEDTKQMITPGPDSVADITQTKISELALAENENHPLISTTELDADPYRPFAKNSSTKKFRLSREEDTSRFENHFGCGGLCCFETPLVMETSGRCRGRSG